MKRVDIERLLVRVLYGNNTAVSDLEAEIESGFTTLAQIIEHDSELSSEQIEATDKIYKELIREEPDYVLVTTNAVKSSNVSKVGYNYEKKILAVEFKGGSTYIYPEVEPEEYNKLMLSESIGSAFHAFKNSHKDFKKISGR